MGLKMLVILKYCRMFVVVLFSIKGEIVRWISLFRNVGQRSLKVTEISAIRKLGCGFLFAFYSNYGRICIRL